MNNEKSMKEKDGKEKADLKAKIAELKKQVNNEKSMKEISEKKTDEVLNFLELQVTCPVCLMIPRTKKITVCRNGHTTCETCKR